MLLYPDQGIFALGVAVGVLGLVLALSLIVSYAYEEPTLLALAGYLAAMVAASFLLVRLGMSATRASQTLLVTGPAVLSGLLLWLLTNRQATVASRAGLAVVALSSAVVAGLQGVTGAGMATTEATALAAQGATVVWVFLLLGFSIYLVVKSWHTAGPWKWWVLAGHAAGLMASSLFLLGLLDAGQAHWPLVLMLLLQVPPVYLALVWRSRLLNESRLRSASAETVDPLTGLATNTVLVERLMRVMSRAHQSSTNSALFLIEVKNWQGLLNELGAEFSEKLLLEAALRLRRAIGDNDLAARIGGGRFAIVAQGLAGDEDITSLATRLVVTGLRIDSPLLSGVEFHFRVLVSRLKLSRPMPLPETQIWLDELAIQFAEWPSSHRTRSILFVSGRELTLPASLKAEPAY
jgi:GGDEF domain-containing protein